MLRLMASPMPLQHHMPPLFSHPLLPSHATPCAHMAAVMLRLIASGGLVAVSIRPCNQAMERIEAVAMSGKQSLMRIACGGLPLAWHAEPLLHARQHACAASRSVGA